MKLTIDTGLSFVRLDDIQVDHVMSSKHSGYAGVTLCGRSLYEGSRNFVVVSNGAKDEAICPDCAKVLPLLKDRRLESC